MSKEKTKLSIFSIVIISFVAVFLTILLCLCIWLRDVLAEYESVQPSHIAEEIMKEYFSSPSLERVISEYGNVSEQDYSKLSAYFSEIYKDGFIFSTASTDDENSAKYNVSCNSKKVASFVLVKTGDKTKHGFESYKLNTIDLKIPHSYSYFLELPDGYSLVYDDKIVSATLLETGIKTESSNHMYGNIQGITLSKYKIVSFKADPEITVKTPRGSLSESTYDKETQTFRYDVCYDEVIDDNLASYIMGAVEKYAIYLQDDAVFTSVAPYLDPESVLYENVRLVDTWCVVTHDSWAFDDETLTEYCTYGNGEVISCRVSLTHILKMAYHDDYKDYIDLTLYLRKVGDNYLIYDMSHN